MSGSDCPPSASAEKVVIAGAAGMIGPNMAQTAIMMELSSTLCLYDPFKSARDGMI
ncbi:MAG: hypothetical protein HIU83_06695 [Proteobacteria bacterium]|nr:hypothetical protein [Pseudomonadota bacterium]